MALVTTHSGPVAHEVGPVAGRTMKKTFGGVDAVPIRVPVAVRVPAGSVVALVAGYAAPATLVIRAVAIAASQGAQIHDLGPVRGGRDPAGRMSTGPIMALVATDA